MTTIKSILEELLHSLVGPRCKTYDKQDFPDLKASERCAVCVLYDELDKSVEQIEQLIEEAKPKLGQVKVPKAMTYYHYAVDVLKVFEANLKKVIR